MEQEGLSCFYSRLGVSRNASPEVIRKAFRRYALANHPDKAPPEQREQATKKFQEVQEAFAVLSDAEVRVRVHCFLVLREFNVEPCQCVSGCTWLHLL